MGIFDSIENMFQAEQANENLENLESAVELSEVQERVQTNDKIIREGSYVPSFESREMYLKTADKERELYGMTQQFHKILEAGGISYQEYTDYMTQRSLEDADAALASARKALGGESLSTYIHEENVEKALGGGKEVSFGKSAFAIETELKNAEIALKSAQEKHVKEGNNSIAIEDRAQKVAELQKELTEAKRKEEAEAKAKTQTR